jgi:hypothetical protein
VATSMPGQQLRHEIGYLLPILEVCDISVKKNNKTYMITIDIGQGKVTKNDRYFRFAFIIAMKNKELKYLWKESKWMRDKEWEWDIFMRDIRRKKL